MSTARALSLQVLTIATLLWSWPAWATDDETARLEVIAFCQAMPYKCPKGAEQTTREELREIEARGMVGAIIGPSQTETCVKLIPAARVIRDKRRWGVPLTTEDQHEWSAWAMTCHGWDAHLDKPPALPPISSTLRCVATTTSGADTSTITSTCTLY